MVSTVRRWDPHILPPQRSVGLTGADRGVHGIPDLSAHVLGKNLRGILPAITNTNYHEILPL